MPTGLLFHTQFTFRIGSCLFFLLRNNFNNPGEESNDTRIVLALKLVHVRAYICMYIVCTLVGMCCWKYCILALKEEAYPVHTSLQKTLMGIQSETEVEIDVRKIVLI